MDADTHAAQDRVIDRYGEVLASGQVMLARAGAGQWDRLIDEQHAYIERVDSLVELEGDLALDDARHAIKNALLADIREVEQALTALLQARMNELSDLMTQSRNEHRVRQAYDAGVAG